MLPLEYQFGITFLLALVVSSIVTAFIRKVMTNRKILDIPDQERKIHDKPIPLGGGVALYISLVITMLVLLSIGWLNDERISGHLLIGLAVAAAVLVVGGLLDDKYRLVWWKQLLVPIVAALIVIATGLEISFITNPFGGLIHVNQIQIPLDFFGMQWSFAPVADTILFIWIIGMVYTTKLLDGIDGLTTSVSTVAALVIFIVSLTWDRTGSTTSFLSIALAGTTLGFLVWNWYPAKIFLGEGGSIFLGFMLAVLAVISGGKIATALLVMGIPILDVLWIIYKRIRTGSKLYEGDSRHLHFRLLHAGMSQRQVTVFISLLSLLFGSISFFFSTKGKIVGLAVLVIVMVLLVRFVIKRHEEKSLPSS